ncbi:uncharacterized protein LOC132738970 [Ruditapes philippinarum]|uniref:uncharacterized protein LOC132738970 n=1 Tax=Ruditapes philippinarum TaxID=129788 RepID=UPI00295C2C8F|nr:uncharacterized protein LOC132738970 [Ruditapes philippinarum]
MESGFYVILLLLIFLKLMIWVCVFYSRARRRQIVTQRGLIIVHGDVLAGPTRDRDMIIHGEHPPAMSPVGLDNPAIVANPPSYEEVQRTKSSEEKPPSYDQVVCGNTFSPSSGNILEQPPQYSPVPSNLQQTTVNAGQTTTAQSNTNA